MKMSHILIFRALPVCFLLHHLKWNLPRSEICLRQFLKCQLFQGLCRSLIISLSLLHLPVSSKCWNWAEAVLPSIQACVIGSCDSRHQEQVTACDCSSCILEGKKRETATQGQLKVQNFRNLQLLQNWPQVVRSFEKAVGESWKTCFTVGIYAPQSASSAIGIICHHWITMTRVPFVVFRNKHISVQWG